MFRDFIEALNVVGFSRYALNRRLSFGLEQVYDSASKAVDLMSVNPRTSIGAVMWYLDDAFTLLALIQCIQSGKAFKKRWWQIGPSCDFEDECRDAYNWLESIRTEMRMLHIAIKK